LEDDWHGSRTVVRCLPEIRGCLSGAFVLYTETDSGGKASYRHERSGLGVQVELGPPEKEAPDPAAFDDPDGAAR